MTKIYTLALARETKMEGAETIQWSADFRKMMKALNPPDYITEALKQWEGLPVPKDRAALSSYRFVNGAVPHFWEAVLNTHTRSGLRPDMVRIPLHHWKEFWDAPQEAPEDDLMALMRKVVHAKLIAVKGDRPDAAAVAERIGSPAKLTDVCLVLMALDEYAMGAPVITVRDDYLPERVVSQLDMAGVEYIRDIMPLADAEKLRKDLGWLYAYSVVCSGCRMVVPVEFSHRTRMGESFFINETDFSAPENHQYQITNAVCRLCFGLYGDFRPYQGDFIGAEERAIISSIGICPDVTPDIASALAFTGGMTRNRADALMRGSDEVHGDPEPALCPMVESCKTFCGEMQRDGRLSRPATANGLWQSCEHGAMIGRAAKMAEAQNSEMANADAESEDQLAEVEELVIPKEQMAMF